MSRFPHGAIALVEPGHGHKTFLKKAKPRYALLKYHHANRLLKAGETADSWFPDETQVITTTNIVDDRNVMIPLEDNGHRRGEIDIVREFAPDFHIPADRADYQDFSDELRYEKVKECMLGTIAIDRMISDEGLDTEVIPFIKTGTPRERELCYRTIDELGLDFGAVYCNRYFNGPGGIHIDELLDDLDLLAAESREILDTQLRFMTVSLLSPNVLSRATDAVVAASGQMVGTDRGWRDSITPTQQPEATVRRIYANVETRVRDALNVDVDLSRYQHDQAERTTDSVSEEQEAG